MEGRKLKWYVKEMAAKYGITEEEYLEKYYKQNISKTGLVTEDKEAYHREYYRLNKHKWEEYKNNKCKDGNYVYFIEKLTDDDNYIGMYKVGSCNNIYARVNRMKSCECLKPLIENKIKYAIYYVNLDDLEEEFGWMGIGKITKNERLSVEQHFINRYNPEIRDRDAKDNKDYDIYKASFLAWLARSCIKEYYT